MPQAPDRTLRKLDAHLADPAYSLDALSADLGLSRSQLFRVGKQHTGLSVSRY
jgi:AraC-like DNA-binding protein